jgi:hypothetical protein
MFGNNTMFRNNEYIQALAVFASGQLPRKGLAPWFINFFSSYSTRILLYVQISPQASKGKNDVTNITMLKTLIGTNDYSKVVPNTCIVKYPEFAWLMTRVLDLMIEFIRH